MQLVDYAGQASWSESGITFSHAVKAKRADNPACTLATERPEQESLFGYIWPTLIPLWFPGTPSAVLFQVIPDGPERSILRHDFYFRERELTRQEQSFVDYIDQVLVVDTRDAVVGGIERQVVLVRGEELIHVNW